MWKTQEETRVRNREWLPKPIVLGDRTTSNFDHPENFVVLECVCRLLAKGYDPATLVLEKRYQVGRGASGGKSDITVLRRTAGEAAQKDAPPLLIIECKTFGTEHDAEKQKTIEDGGQLFGYLQQDRSASHLCIYSSRLNQLLERAEIEYRCDIIHAEDSGEAIEKFDRKEKSTDRGAALQTLPLFAHASNRETLHHAWKTTYDAHFQSRGIFEDDFTPYAIGYVPLRGKDLKTFNGENGSTRVFNHFMEILRHNNVSDKENAFNRLCAIILAKLIDEDRDDDAILDFQWFPNRDAPEDLIDRLQRLYKRGMKETLGEDITYYEERDIDQAFAAHRRDMARNEIKKIFRALKFYTNSDFAFKEVHNKKLFEQNTQVVREVVQLFQSYQLKYTSKQAFLGNLFELLLNSGFKQSEGQFFTPIPIARFILRCLPIRERMAAAAEAGHQQIIPRVMDYACGSAHFLTEAVEEIQDDLAALGLDDADNTRWTRDHLWGIEKDYRLARTAKIAMFLHGAGDANILHDDGLDHANPSLPEPGSLDILVANPPYSVKDFKQHLSLKANTFTLLPHLTPSSSEIEALFVERAAQLLKVGGLAGLILPSSILSNSGIYQRTRALLLDKFLIRGIVELGGSAFIATGTNTVVLLLERCPDTHREHFQLRADALYDERQAPQDADFADRDLLAAYCAAAGLPLAAYLDWLADADGQPTEELEGTALFKAYQDEFDKLASVKARRKQVSFKKQSKAEQILEMRGKFLGHCRDAEKTKFVYFALGHARGFADGQLLPQRTTVLRSPEGKGPEQKFVGYKWSNRRGSEGMVTLRDPYDGGLLYAPSPAPASEAEPEDGEHDTARHDPPTKAAHHFRYAFLDTEPDDIPDDHLLAEQLRCVGTAGLFDFARTECDLGMNLSTKEADSGPCFETKYDLIPFGQIATLEYGKPLPERSRKPGKYPVFGSNGVVGTHDDFLVKGPGIVVGRKGSAGRINSTESNFYPIDTTFFVNAIDPKTPLKYIEFLLVELDLESKARALGVPGLNRNEVHNTLVPDLPLPVQKKIVKAIEKIEAEESKARDTIDKSRAAMNQIVSDVYAADHPRKTIDALSTAVQYGLSEAMNEDGRGYKIFRMNEVVDGRMVDNGSMKCLEL